MAEVRTITVDGQKIEITEGAILITALKEHGIYIPSLCYHPQTGYQGRCSLCVIEISNKGNWEAKHACSLTCRSGMEIRTDSLRIKKLRATAAAFLLLRGPFADSALERMLKKMADDFLPITPEFIGPTSQQGCILCGRCIAVCKKIKKNKLTFIHRGQKLKVAYVDNAADPTGCGTCTSCKQHCPTGFIKTNGESAFAFGSLYGK